MEKSLLPYLLILPSAIYSLITLCSARALFRRSPPLSRVALPPLSLLKPVKGLDRESYLNFDSFCQQDYPEYQIIFALQSGDDPALPVIRELMATYGDLDITLIVDSTFHGPNAKVGNLINACSMAKHDIFVISDSDVRVGPDYLRNLATEFHDSSVGLVTSLYRGRGGSGATAIEALGFTVEMIPNVIVAERFEGMSFALGASMAVRRTALEDIGGLAVLADYLADDYQLGHMVRRAGWKIVLSADFVDCVLPDECFRDLFVRQVRWCRTMRVSRPAGYFFSVLTQPFPAVISLFSIYGITMTTLQAVGVIYLLRSAVLTYLSRTCFRDRMLPQYLWLLPLRDALYTLTWALAFVGDRVHWRGEAFVLERTGRMRKVGINS